MVSQDGTREVSLRAKTRTTMSQSFFFKLILRSLGEGENRIERRVCRPCQGQTEGAASNGEPSEENV